MNNNTRFLIKFLKEKKYAVDLCYKGELFMRSADDFIRIEKETNLSGRGDIREGLIFNSVRIGMNFPIYCMYSCFENEIIKDEILINKKVIEDFCDNNNGYLVVIDYVRFMDKMVSENFEGFKISFGEVRYGSANDDYNKDIFRYMKPNALFIKDSSFEYQNEFRILVYKSLELMEDKESIDGSIETRFAESPSKKYATHIFKLGDLTEFANVVEVSKLKEYNNTHLALSLKEISK